MRTHSCWVGPASNVSQKICWGRTYTLIFMCNLDDRYWFSKNPLSTNCHQDEWVAHLGAVWNFGFSKGIPFGCAIGPTSRQAEARTETHPILQEILRDPSSGWKIWLSLALVMQQDWRLAQAPLVQERLALGGLLTASRTYTAPPMP